MILIYVDSGWTRVVKDVEKFKKALDVDALVNAERSRDAHIHVHKMRARESVAARFQVPAVKLAVAVLVDGHKGTLRVVETALRAEETAELKLPGQLYHTVHFKSMAQGKIRGTVIECSAIVKNPGLWDEIAVASKKGTGCVRAARASATLRDISRVCDNRGNTDKTIGRESIITENGTGAEIGIERIVLFGDIRVAAAHCKPMAHALFERNNATDIGAAVPGSKTIYGRDCATAVVDARSKRKIRLSNAEDVDDVFMVVVERDHQIAAELPLNAKSVAARVWSSKTRVDGYWKVAGLGHIKRERSERTPEPEIGWHARGRVCGGEKSART